MHATQMVANCNLFTIQNYFVKQQFDKRRLSRWGVSIYGEKYLENNKIFKLFCLSFVSLSRSLSSYLLLSLPMPSWCAKRQDKNSLKTCVVCFWQKGWEISHKYLWLRSKENSKLFTLDLLAACGPLIWLIESTH